MVKATVDGFTNTFEVINKRADNGLVEMRTPNGRSTWFADPKFVTILDGSPQPDRPSIDGARRKLLRALEFSPLTDQALSERAAIHNVMWATRMRSELVLAGLITDSGKRQVSDSGAQHIIWSITERGRTELDRRA